MRLIAASPAWCLPDELGFNQDVRLVWCLPVFDDGGDEMTGSRLDEYGAALCQHVGLSFDPDQYRTGDGVRDFHIVMPV